MNQTFLIPSGNSKKQSLIFGFLLPVDLIILAIGIFLTFMLLLTLPIELIWGFIVAIIPALIAAVLVFPIPNYHNSRIIIKEVFTYFKNRRIYIWRGWCSSYEQSDEQR